MFIFPKNLRYSAGQVEFLSAIATALLSGVGASAIGSAGAGAAAGSGLGSAILGGSAISAGGSLLGGMINKPERPGLKRLSTLSKDQKQINRVIMDFLLGISRGPSGQETGRNPLLTRLLKKGIPDRVIAPLTKSQHSGLDFAKELLSKVRNPVRPDQDYLKALARGELPTKSAALGAVLLPGETATVGEAGVEKVKVEKDGTVRVIPNPKTISSPIAMALAAKKGEKARIKYGTDFGMATGRRLWEYELEGQKKKAYLPRAAPNIFDPGQYWEKDQPYTSSLKSKFEQEYLPQHYGEEDWYNLYSTKFGGQIEGVGSQYYDKWRAKDRLTGLDPLSQYYKPEATVQKGYGEALGEFWQTMPEHWSNPDVEEIMGATPEAAQEGFYEHLRTEPQYGLSTGLGMQEGRYGWEDPFAVDVANLQKAQSDYLSSAGYEMGEGGWAKIPKPGEPDPFDWSSVAAKLEPDDYDAFDAFLKDFEGGVFKDVGFRFNPETGKEEFTGNPEHVEGLKVAVDAYQQQKADKAAQALEDKVPDDADKLPADDDEFLSSLYTALAEYTGSFDATEANEAFDASVMAPAMKTLEQEIIPSMMESLGGGALFSSARENVIQKVTQDLTEELAGKRSEFIYGQQQAHRDRGLSAVSLGMDLARLPTDLRSAESDIDYRRAAAASIFAGMEMERALVDAKITNDQLLALVTAWPLFEAERNYNQAELDAAMVNAMKEGRWDQIFGLMMGYTDMNQIAFTPD